MPKRVQIHPITRRHPEGSIFVGDNSRYENPFKVIHADGRWLVVDENDVVYEPWGNSQRDAEAEAHRLYAEVYIDELGSLAELRGRDLACTCELPAPNTPDYCHASALIPAANGGLLPCRTS